MTIAANIGHTAITTFDAACPDSVVGIQARPDRCDVFWLKAVLETKRDALDGLATQNAQKNINLEVLRPLLLTTPPLPEQRRIAEILSTWDSAISTVEKLIANALAQKSALMQQFLTGEKRLPGFLGAWQLIRLGQAFDDRSDRGLNCERYLVRHWLRFAENGPTASGQSGTQGKPVS